MTFEAEQLGDSGPELASLLRELRKRAGLSGDRLAARCNMSQSKVSRIESGKSRPSLVDVEQILRALDAPPSMVAEVGPLPGWPIQSGGTFGSWAGRGSGRDRQS
ncbi:helix-turn-helix domain-containing protein [Streptomyces scopuliridis]|uniref:helix-turn-helix domain-containing protein n=1 Tax=Streptomyces scopuliridis TaxID=452529 RepID=UPI0036B1AC1D